VNGARAKALKDMRILVVEGEAHEAEQIREQLTALSAGLVDIVDSGRDAIISAEWKRPDLVLMDVSLNGLMTGVEAAAEIRKHSLVPIVFLTTSSDWEAVSAANSIDASGYLIKPFNEPDLISVIESVSRRQELEKKTQ